MKITHLKLHGFRSAVDLDLDLDAPRVLLAGLNGAGKSSIRDSISWILRGACVGTDAKGTGWESLSPNGTGLHASAQLTGVGWVDRHYLNGSRGLVVEGVQGESSLQQAAIYGKLQTTPQLLQAVLDTAYFLNLHHAEAKALLLGLLNVTVKVDSEELTLDQVEAKYKAAFQERTVAKARAKAHSVPPKPEGEALPPVEAIETRLAQVRQESTQEQQKSAHTLGKKQILQAKLVDAQSLIPVHAINPQDIEAAERAVAMLEADALGGAVVSRSQTVEASLATSVDLMTAGKKYQQLEDFKPKHGCILDSGIPCPQAKIKFTNRAKALWVEIEAAQKTFNEAPKPSEKPSPDDDVALQHAKAKLAGLVEANRRADAARAVNESKAKDAEALIAELAALGDTSAAQAKIDDLNARIGKGEMLLRRAQEYWNAMQRVESGQKAGALIKAEVDRLEKLCDELGPNGLRVQALESALNDFHAAIVPYTAPFGWNVMLSAEPWGVSVNGRPVETYSESEQLRIGIAIQIAVAQMSGLSFAIVDRLDMLDAGNRNRMTKLLLATDLEQVIILATREPDQPLPSLPNVKAYRLAKDGPKTVIAERTA